MMSKPDSHIYLWAWYQTEFGLEKATRYEGIRIERALRSYHDSSGFYPSVLSKLIDGKPLRGEWNRDEWEQAYYYRVTANRSDYIFISSGKDKLLGTDDDIIFKH